MITLRDVAKTDERIYTVWEHDLGLKVYLSRLYPNNCRVGNYDASKVCWFIIEESTCDIGSVWLERDIKESDTMVFGIFIFEEQY